MKNVYQNSDNLDKMGKFLEKYNLPKSTRMKQKIVSPILNKEIKYIVKTSPKQKTLNPDGFIVNSTKLSWEK